MNESTALAVIDKLGEKLQVPATMIWETVASVAKYDVIQYFIGIVTLIIFCIIVWKICRKINKIREDSPTNSFSIKDELKISNYQLLLTIVFILTVSLGLILVGFFGSTMLAIFEPKAWALLKILSILK